jgi:hypothetical protein
VHGQVSVQALVKDHQQQAHMHVEALTHYGDPPVPSLAFKHAVLVVADANVPCWRCCRYYALRSSFSSAGRSLLLTRSFKAR